MARITCREELEQLLDEHGWFELVNCIAVNPPPGHGTPERVEFLLREDATDCAYSELAFFDVWQLTAIGVRTYAFEGEVFEHSPDHRVEIVGLVVEDGAFGVGMDVPTYVSVLADEFEFERLAGYTAPRTPDTMGG